MKRVWLTVAVLVVLAVASYMFVYRDRVYLGVHVAGYDLGGLTRPQAEEFLRTQVAPSLAKQTVQMRAGQKLWAPTYTDLGARLDPQATADIAYQEGRQGLLAPLQPFLLLAHATDIDPRITVDAAAFNAYLNRLAAGVAVAPKDATVAVAGSTTYAVPGQRGLRLDTPALALSPEQQQRLCISRLLAVEPEVLLMDEPCSALDPIATGRIEEMIQELKKAYSIVIVTHNMQQAARVSSQTAYFLLGELVEFGPTARIFTSPRDPRTEQYITGRFG